MSQSNPSSTGLTALVNPEPRQLAEQLFSILNDPELSPKEKKNLLLQITVGLVGGVAAVFYRQEKGVLLAEGQLLSPQAASLSHDVLTEMQQGAMASLQEKGATVSPLAMAPQASVFACPLFSTGDESVCSLAVVILAGEKAPEPFLVVLQLLVTVLAQVRKKHTYRVGSLLHAFASSTTPIDSIRTLAALYREKTGCAVVAIASCSGNKKVRLEHVSDVVSPDVRTDQGRRYLKVMQEVANSRRITVWPAVQGHNGLSESLVLKELVLANGMGQGMGVPLLAGDKLLGIVLLLWPSAEKDLACLQEVIDTAPLSGMYIDRFVGSGRRGQHIPTVKNNPRKTFALTAVALVLLATLAFFPKEFKLHPPAVVQPIQIRYVVARFDGLLQKVFVEPGDRVEQESQLALLDGRELELELRSVQADAAKSLKMRDNYMAEGQVADAQIAFLEYSRLQERETLLLGRQKQLLLVSPYTGIVLRGDLKQSQGGPVAKGEVLFEVAPLDRVELQLLVTDEDIAHVQEGAVVAVQFDAFAGRVWKGRVARLAPQAELVQGENVFPVTFEVENEDGLLLPGMQGVGAISCGKRSVLWIYFHKPWYALRRLLVSFL